MTCCQRDCQVWANVAAKISFIRSLFCVIAQTFCYQLPHGSTFLQWSGRERNLNCKTSVVEFLNSVESHKVSYFIVIIDNFFSQIICATIERWHVNWNCINAAFDIQWSRVNRTRGAFFGIIDCVGVIRWGEWEGDTNLCVVPFLFIFRIVFGRTFYLQLNLFLVRLLVDLTTKIVPAIRHLQKVLFQSIVGQQQRQFRHPTCQQETSKLFVCQFIFLFC